MSSKTQEQIIFFLNKLELLIKKTDEEETEFSLLLEQLNFPQPKKSQNQFTTNSMHPTAKNITIKP